MRGFRIPASVTVEFFVCVPLPPFFSHLPFILRPHSFQSGRFSLHQSTLKPVNNLLKNALKLQANQSRAHFSPAAFVSLLLWTTIHVPCQPGRYG